MVNHNETISVSARSLTAQRAGLLSALLAGVVGGCATPQENLEIENTQHALIGGLECNVVDINNIALDPPFPELNSCSNSIISGVGIITARVVSSSIPEERRRFAWKINGTEARTTDGIYQLRSEGGCIASECSIRVTAPCANERVFVFQVAINDKDFPNAPVDVATATATVEAGGIGDCAPVTQAPAGGGGGGGLEEGECEIVFAEEICHNFPASPIVFDLGEGGYDLTSVREGVRFDIDADGAPEKVSWTEGGSDDAFLALDRNGNGEIDDGGELFGTATKLADGTTSAHGYIPLAELDLEANGGNHNGYIDEGDRDFGTLLLWTDRNHDGRSSKSELLHLNDRGIFAIALQPDESDVVDEHGNRLAYVSPAYAWRRNRIQRIRTTDIFFWYRELVASK